MKRFAWAVVALAVGCGRDGGGSGARVADSLAAPDEVEADVAVDSGDVAAVDSGDVAAVDSGDVAAVDSGDVAAVDSGDVAAVDSGDVAAVDSEDIAAVDSGDVAAVDSGDVAVGDTSVGPTDLANCETVATDFVPLGEASGVALLDERGDRLLVVADSGNAGAALVLDLVRGESVATTLPLGVGAGDDLEGLERAPDGRIFGLASTGHLRAWRETTPAAFELVLGPVPVSDDPAFVCDPFGVNCGANFEGLCLHPAPTGADCAGWAASKALGQLVCLRAEGGGYRLDPGVRIDVTVAERLSGCAFEPSAPYRVIAAGNLYSGSALWEVGGASVRALTLTGTGNQEAIVWMPGHRLQSFGDGQELLGEQSPRAAIECR